LQRPPGAAARAVAAARPVLLLRLETTKGMNDDPRALLNLEEDPETVRGRRGIYWVLALATLAACTAAGIIRAVTLPRVESDWFGVRLIIASAAGLLSGAVLCVLFAALSVARRERHSVWAV